MYFVRPPLRYAEAVSHSERFSNEAALAKLAADWPATRLIEIYIIPLVLLCYKLLANLGLSFRGVNLKV